MAIKLKSASEYKTNQQGTKKVKVKSASEYEANKTQRYSVTLGNERIDGFTKGAIEHLQEGKAIKDYSPVDEEEKKALVKYSMNIIKNNKSGALYAAGKRNNTVLTGPGGAWDGFGTVATQRAAQGLIPTSPQELLEVDWNYVNENNYIKQLKKEKEEIEKEIEPLSAEKGKYQREMAAAKRSYLPSEVAKNQEKVDYYNGRIEPLVEKSRQLEEQIKNYNAMDEHTENLLRVSRNYGIDVEKFDYNELNKWAKQHGYVLLGTTAGTDYRPTYKTSEQEREDYEVLSYLASMDLAEKLALKHPVVSSVGTVVTAPLRGMTSALGTVEDAVDTVTGKGINLYSKARHVSDGTNTIRNTVKGEHASKWFGGAENKVIGNVGEFVFDTAMSMGDNIVNLLTAKALVGGLGLTGAQATKWTSNITSALLSSDATYNGIANAKKKGLSDTKALVLGISTGTVELLTEKYSLDNILGNPKGLTKTLLKGFVAEGSEEVAANVSGKLLDRIISGEESDIVAAINEYKKDGKSDKDALIYAIGDSLLDDLRAGLSGGFSGMGMSGAYHGINRVKTSRVGRNIVNGKYSDVSLKNVIAKGLDYKSGTDIRQKAEAIAAMEIGDNKKNNYHYKIGELAMEILADDKTAFWKSKSREQETESSKSTVGASEETSQSADAPATDDIDKVKSIVHPDSVEALLDERSKILADKYNLDYQKVFNANFEAISSKESSALTDNVIMQYADALAQSIDPNTDLWLELAEYTDDIGQFIFDSYKNGYNSTSADVDGLLKKFTNILDAVSENAVDMHRIIYGDLSNNAKLTNSTNYTLTDDSSAPKMRVELSQKEVDSVVSVMHDTLKQNSLHSLSNHMKKSGNLSDIDKLARMLVNIYRDNGNIVEFGKFFKDGGMAVIDAIESIKTEGADTHRKAKYKLLDDFSDRALPLGSMKNQFHNELSPYEWKMYYAVVNMFDWDSNTKKMEFMFAVKLGDKTVLSTYKKGKPEVYFITNEQNDFEEGVLYDRSDAERILGLIGENEVQRNKTSGYGIDAVGERANKNDNNIDRNIEGSGDGRRVSYGNKEIYESDISKDLGGKNDETTRTTQKSNIRYDENLGREFGKRAGKSGEEISRKARNAQSGTFTEITRRETVDGIEYFEVSKSQYTEEMKNIDLENQKKYGVKTRYFSGAASTYDGTLINGFYSNGILYLQCDDTDSIETIRNHEITHHFEDSVAYKTLLDSVKNKMSEKDFKAWKAEVWKVYGTVIFETLSEEYDEAGGTLSTEELLDIMNDYLESEMMANLNAGTVDFAKEYAGEIADFRNGIDMTSDSSKVEVSTESKAENKVSEYAKQIDTGKEDKLNDYPRFLIVGKKSLTADKEAYNRAVEMDKQGYDIEELWKETGWSKGVDGHFKTELDDSKYEFMMPSTSKENLYVKDFVKHDKLFAAYPQIKDIPVLYDENMDDEGEASYVPNMGEHIGDVGELGIIRINPQKSIYELKKSMLHELQHVIQFIEGFEQGASESYWRQRIKEGYDIGNINDYLQLNVSPAHQLYEDTAGEREARDVVDRMNFTLEARRKIFPYSMDDSEGVVFADGSSVAAFEKGTKQIGAMWTIQQGVLDKKEVAAFYSKVSELRNNKYRTFRQSADGNYIFSVGNKLIYSDADYEYPKIKTVITFETDDENLIDYARECFYEGETYRRRFEDTKKIAEIMLGEETVKRADYNSNATNERVSNHSRESESGTAADSRSGEDVRRSISADTQDRIERIGREEIFSVPKSVTSKLSNQIERWLNGEMTSNEMFEFGNTPVVLRELGAEILPVIMSQNTMVKLNGEKHSVSLENIRNLPQNLAEPLMVFKSATVPNAFLILTQIEDMNGNPVVAALHLNKKEKHIEVNRIASVYSKNNIWGFLSTQTEKGNLRYIDKIKSQNWSQSRGLQLPKLADTNPDNNSILEKEDIVNKYYTQKKYKNSERAGNVKFSVATSTTTQDRIEEIAKEEVFHEELTELARKNKQEFISRVRQNEQLQKRLDNAQRQMRLTKVPLADRAKVEKLIKSIVTDMHSVINPRDIHAEVLSIYDEYIAAVKKAGNVPESVQSATDNMVKRFTDVAADIIDNAQDIAVDEDFARLKGWLKNTDIKFPDDAKAEAHFAEFRKRHFGSISLTNDGLPIDMAYNELCEVFPYIFNKSVTAPADQLNAIADALQALKPETYNPHAEYIEDAIEHVVSLFALEADGISVTKDTRADRLVKKAESQKVTALEKQKEAFQRKYDKHKEKSDEQINKLKEQLKAHSYTQYWERRLSSEEKSAAIKAVRQNQKISMAKAHIRKMVSELKHGLDTTEKSGGIPKELVKAIAEVCSAIDFHTDRITPEGDATKASLKLDALQVQYDNLKNNPDYDIQSEWHEEISEYIKQLNNTVRNKRVIDLNLMELSALEDILVQIRHTISNAKKQIGIDNAMENREIGMQICEDLNGKADFIAPTKKMLVKRIGTNVFAANTLNPMRVAEMISGYNRDGEFYKLFRQLNEGVHKGDMFKMDATKPFNVLMEGPGNQALMYDFLTQLHDTGIKDTNGNTVMLPKNMICEVIMLWERKQGRAHLETGGMTIPNIKLFNTGKTQEAYTEGAVRTVAITEWDITRLRSMLESYDKAWIDEARILFNEKSHKAINETSLQLVGRTLANAKNYIPIHTDTKFVHSDIEGLKVDATLEGAGSLKSVVENAKQPVLITGLSYSTSEHIDFVAKYHGLAIPIRNFNKVYNVTFADENDTTQSVKDTIGHKWGAKIQKGVIEQTLRDLQTTRNRESDVFNKVMGTIQSNWVGATLNSNPSVALKQLTSYVTASSVLGSTPLVKALPYFTRTKATIEEIDRYTGIHFKRRLGYSTQELGDRANRKTGQGLANKARKAMSQSQITAWVNHLPKGFFPTNWMQSVDCRVAAVLWEATKYYVSDTLGIAKGSENYWKEVTQIYERTIEETQSNYDTLHKPEVLKSTSEMTRLISMFQNDALQGSGLLWTAYNDWNTKHQNYKTQSTSENKKALEAAQERFKKAAFAQVSSAITLATLTLVARTLLRKVKPYKDDEKNEVNASSISKQVGMDTLENLFTNAIPVLGNLLVSAKDTFVYGYDLASVPTFDTVQNLIDAISGVYGVIDKWDITAGEDKWNKVREALAELAISTATAFGIPAQNVINMFNGVKGYVGDIKEGDFFHDIDEIIATSRRVFSYADLASAIASGDRKKEHRILDYYKNIGVEVQKGSLTTQLKPAYVKCFVDEPEKAHAIRKSLVLRYDYSDDAFNDWIYEAYAKALISDEEYAVELENAAKRAKIPFNYEDIHSSIGSVYRNLLKENPEEASKIRKKLSKKYGSADFDRWEKDVISKQQKDRDKAKEDKAKYE